MEAAHSFEWVSSKRQFPRLGLFLILLKYLVRSFIYQRGAQYEIDLAPAGRRHQYQDSVAGWPLPFLGEN